MANSVDPVCPDLWIWKLRSLRCCHWGDFLRDKLVSDMIGSACYNILVVSKIIQTQHAVDAVIVNWLAKSKIIHFLSKFPSAQKPKHDKTNKITCTHSKDSDRPRHPPSQSRLCCPHKPSVLRYPVHSTNFARWAHIILLVLLCCGSFEAGEKLEIAGRGSSIGSMFAWHASGPEFDPHIRHILSWTLGHEKISAVILPLLLIQEEQLSVTGERRCTKYWETA